MTTRTSNRSTKAVKFIDSAPESDANEDVDPSIDMKADEKKIRRNIGLRRKRANDDEEWNAQNEQIEDEEDEEIRDDTPTDDELDATKKFQVNRSLDSVYDFG